MTFRMRRFTFSTASAVCLLAGACATDSDSIGSSRVSDPELGSSSRVGAEVAASIRSQTTGIGTGQPDQTNTLPPVSATSAPQGTAPVATGAAPGPPVIAAPQEPMVATAISVGTDMACAVLVDGSVWCWGESNTLGQLGDGTTTFSLVPVRVAGVSDAVAVTAGGTWNSGGQGAASSAFACALLSSGSVLCWGDAGEGQLGDTDVRWSSLPVTISGVSNVQAVAAGNWHVCVLLTGGSVQCWGDNQRGQLGNGSTSRCWLSDRCPPGGNSPVSVVGIDTAVAIAAHGSEYSCAVLSDGTIQCWGGAVGGGVTDPSLPTSLPEFSTTPSGLDVGYGEACAVSSDDGTVRCWGANLDQQPVSAVSLRSPAVTVAVGQFAKCALLNDSTVQCWSWSETSKSEVTLTDAQAVSVGYNQACALTHAGSVVCWVTGGGGVPVTVSGF